jgi:hypothetical protein
LWEQSVESGVSGRFFATVDFVNQLEAETGPAVWDASPTSLLAGVVILDELGYLLFAQLSQGFSHRYVR